MTERYYDPPLPEAEKPEPQTQAKASDAPPSFTFDDLITLGNNLDVKIPRSS